MNPAARSGERIDLHRDRVARPVGPVPVGPLHEPHEPAVQEIEQSRLITKDRAGLVELSGRLIELDQRSLIEQARLIGLDLQLNEQQAGLFAQQVGVIQTEMQVLRDQVSRELAELGLSTSFLAIVDQLIGGSASSQVQQLATSVSSGGGDGSGDDQR